MIKFVNYQSKTSIRSITLIDGQPYYLSTGKSSKLEGLWLPFIMLRPTFDFNPKSVPDHIRSVTFRSIFSREDIQPGYYIKADAGMIRTNKIDINIEALINILKKHFSNDDAVETASRIARKSDLINVIRLSTLNYSKKELISDLIQAANLNPEELKAINNPFVLEDTPEFSTTDPDQINGWLLSRGAKDIQHLVAVNLPREKSHIHLQYNGDRVSYCEVYLLCSFVESQGHSLPKESLKFIRMKVLERQLQHFKSLKQHTVDFFQEFLGEIFLVVSEHRDQGIIGFLKQPGLKIHTH